MVIAFGDGFELGRVFPGNEQGFGVDAGFERSNGWRRSPMLRSAGDVERVSRKWRIWTIRLGWMIGRYIHIQFQSRGCAGPNRDIACVSE